METTTQKRRARVRRALARGGFGVVVTLAAGLWPAAAALAAYSASTELSYAAAVPEAVELSGLVASPTYPNWYWTHSDVWKTTDSFVACSGLTESALAQCQQVQRARIWALYIDPVTHKVTDSRSFALSDPQWALDPNIAQNNDWEDIALSPPRTDADGVVRTDLILSATGDAKQNRVYDANGQDITCDTRRLIELREPDLNDPAATTWTPWQIFDLKNYVGLSGVRSCNVESLAVSVDGSGQPTAYLVTRTGRKVLSRSLNEFTGRDPLTPRAAVGSGEPYEPSVTYVGLVRDSKGLQFTAADTNGTYASLLARSTSTSPCQIVTWPLGSGGLGATLTGTSPTKSQVSCNWEAEGLSYVRSGQDPSVLTNDFMALSDARGATFHYWYFPDS
jgi:hypothetical protein